MLLECALKLMFVSRTKYKRLMKMTVVILGMIISGSCSLIHCHAYMHTPLFQVHRQKSSRQEDDSWFFVNMDMPDLYTPFIIPHDTMQRHEEVQPVASDLPRDPHGRVRDVQPR